MTLAKFPDASLAQESLGRLDDDAQRDAGDEAVETALPHVAARLRPLAMKPSNARAVWAACRWTEGLLESRAEQTMALGSIVISIVRRWWTGPGGG